MNSQPFYTIPYHKALTLGRRLCRKYGYADCRLLEHEKDPDVAGEHIYNLLNSGQPCMVARFGANEINTVFNYIGMTKHRGDALGYVKGKTGPWWWNKQILWQMEVCAGFFPTDDANVRRFCELMLKDTPEVDVLGVWLHEETCVEPLLTNAYKMAFTWLSPWFSKNPWSRALEGKRVLVINPFDDLIKQQYEKRELLFKDHRILPDFADLKVIKAVQSFGGNSNSCGFNTWFDALQQMQDEMDRTDYDVCLLGCGAYGFPLAAHAKRQGKQAVHLGGNLQILFGIYGKAFLRPDRWEYRLHGLPTDFYPRMINEHWVRPGDAYKPKLADYIDGASYW